ncbi:hypothetical protein CI109_101286 [Kwoniella shandongensis]|uniref:RING-type E3 ubiquitin transferase n=1 Tax=Kwoniella shandongensis TaxID=1734106 RepID=A0A5M6BWX4_9TREE|nr:uncharacterized protein CI109_005339 [Kwoniella shandongensis]KAA5526382.1 hypothetical protein CI109_005339 [Kwoniella shandongensis]
MVPRLILYGAASTLLAGGVISSALKSRANFYAAGVAIGRSSGALMILANFALFNAICVGIGLKKIFFGQLRAIEYEHLFERLWIFLTESLLALTIFRDDFSAPFALMYAVLLFLKCFHWITADRVDYMDQIPPPGPPPTFHLRITLIITFLTLFDLLLVTYSLESILVDGVSSMVLFASEFTILLASILGTSARYGVGIIDLRRARGRADAPSWEAKSMWLFYVDLAVDFVKLLTYLTFFTVILLHYGLPLHILRDVYMTLRSFISRCGDLIRYRRATRDMDALYPDATEEEMERQGDRTCIICREEMIPRAQVEREGTAAGPDGEGGPNETPKRLSCGHIFHFHCLRSWLERQQSCPTCRRDVLHTATQTRPGAAQNNRNPPPPAPGAVPQAPNPVEIMQQNFNEYFRLPDPPVAPRTGLAVPAHNGLTPTPTTRVVPEEGEDQRLQRGIWGGPITPGRFFPAPLGAAPRSSTSFGGGQPSSGLGAGPTTRRQPAPGSTDRIVLPAAGQPSTSALSTPQLASGSVTPFSSNPPTIFRSTGSAPPAPANAENEARKAEPDARRQAAEAALRRLGLGFSAGGEALGNPTTSSSVTEPSSKGKGKEKEQVGDDWDRKPTHLPRLSPVGAAVVQNQQDPLVTTRIPHLVRGGLEMTPEGTRRGLEDRLRVLREVDETLWGLVGELMRVKSAWEGEDGIGTTTADENIGEKEISSGDGEGEARVAEDKGQHELGVSEGEGST